MASAHGTPICLLDIGNNPSSASTCDLVAPLCHRRRCLNIIPMALLFLLSLLAVHHLADAACGDTGSAYFNTYVSTHESGGELYYAARCFVLKRHCTRTNLPEAARGVNESDSSNVRAFYGTNISLWCTGQNEIFNYTFNGMSVSHGYVVGTLVPCLHRRRVSFSCLSHATAV